MGQTAEVKGGKYSVPFGVTKVVCRTAIAPCEITLINISDSQADEQGYKVMIVDADGNASTNNITVKSSGQGKIDGATEKVYSTDNVTVGFIPFSDYYWLSFGEAVSGGGSSYELVQTVTFEQVNAQAGNVSFTQGVIPYRSGKTLQSVLVVCTTPFDADLLTFTVGDIDTALPSQTTPTVLRAAGVSQLLLTPHEMDAGGSGFEIIVTFGGMGVITDRNSVGEFKMYGLFIDLP
jgi:hypothetical protein